MNWDTIQHILAPFGIIETRQAGFERADSIFLLDSDAEDRDGMVYLTNRGTEGRAFHKALIVAAGACRANARRLIRLEGGALSQALNVMLRAGRILEGLDSALSRCGTDQEILDAAGRHTGLPMFYLDPSYRILAITRDSSFGADPEWIHMTEQGYLSPGSARLMQEKGDMDLLAAATGPIVYHSKGIYPFPSVVCNVHCNGAFASRLNLLCVDGDTSPLRVELCAIIVSHLERLLGREAHTPADGPLQSMLIDLLRGIRLSESLINDRLSSHPALQSGIFRLFYVDPEGGSDRQVAHYYASLLKGLSPGDSLLPLVFDDRLALLAHGAREEDFGSLMVKLAHFFSSYRLRCGVSNSFRRLSALRGHLEQAMAALEGEESGGLYFFRHIMLDHIIGHIPQERAEILISPDILRLQEAEKDFSFSLVDTLRAYLTCNCNLNRTAEHLFLHKNTMLYRLNHIRSLLQCDLNDADERLLLMLSFKLLDREKE